jgi:hypothetical protein
VVLDEWGDWQCESPACQSGQPCTHVGQAQRFRRMRGTKPAGNTVELEYRDEDVRDLAEAVTQVKVSTRERRPAPWTVVLAAAAIAGLSSGITYVAATSRAVDVPTTAQPRYVAASPAQPMPTPEPLPPVRVVNVFDPEEVFEFPAGTSESEARHAAAELLLQRARQRLASLHP